MRRSIALLVLSIIWMAPSCFAQTSSDWPILSEFVCNPMNDLETEWIELYNSSSTTVNLAQYQIGDALGLRDISDTGILLQPGEYIVLTENVDRFHEYYVDFTGRVFSPVGWQTLNNYGGELVRLADMGDNTFDSVYYENGFADNRSYERYISPDSISYWGASFSGTGSTPGQPNTFYHPRISSIDLLVSPDPFSPDGDGFEDETTISFGMPEADEFELVIYDIAGRKVKTFYESSPSIPGDMVWDGRGDDGEALPVGIYIIYARVEGGVSMEAKKTVVIAR